MRDRTGFQFSIATLFWLVAAVAVPLGLSMNWTAVPSLLVCTTVAALLWIATRRRLAGAAFVIYVALLPLAFFVTVTNVNPSNPYVRQFNERLQRLALDAQLIGDSENRVTNVLGTPTSVWNYWNVTDGTTGKPEPGARFITTYNFAPYWYFPFSQFQVHCQGGVVQSIELYDD
jgi:hypothetical protein